MNSIKSGALNGILCHSKFIRLSLYRLCDGVCGLKSAFNEIQCSPFNDLLLLIWYICTFATSRFHDNVYPAMSRVCFGWLVLCYSAQTSKETVWLMLLLRRSHFLSEKRNDSLVRVSILWYPNNYNLPLYPPKSSNFVFQFKNGKQRL